VALEDSINNVAAAIRYFADRAFPTKLPRPKPLTIKLISEERRNDMDFLTYEATLPVVPAGKDVDTQELTVSVDGTAQPLQTLDAAATVATFEVPQDSSVTLSLVYVDDGGQRSAPREQTFTALDTIAPDAPGDFGEVRLVSERTE